MKIQLPCILGIAERLAAIAIHITLSIAVWFAVKNGKLMLTQSMTQQIERIEKEQKNAELMKELCEKLRNETTDLKTLNASFYLSDWSSYFHRNNYIRNDYCNYCRINSKNKRN